MKAKSLSELNVTKQLCNRLLEPYMWHTVLITATEWENFFALRCPCYYIAGDKNAAPFSESRLDFKSRKQLEKELGLPDIIVEAREKGEDENLAWLKLNKGQAEIHMMALAEAMWDAYNESTPKELKAGEWHIPFVDNIETTKVLALVHTELTKGKREYAPNANELQPKVTDAYIKIATAMCAGVSYTVVGEDGKELNYEKLIKRHNKLAEDGHWSPFEHCAKAMGEERWYYTSQQGKGTADLEANLGWSGNFRGFIQYRKMFNNENITL